MSRLYVSDVQDADSGLSESKVLSASNVDLTRRNSLIG